MYGDKMSVPLKPEHLEQLKVFVDMCMKNPEILHQSELSFVKTFIEHFGGQIPEVKKDETPSKEPEQPKEPEPEAEPESEESDLELDMSEVVEPDTDAPQSMGDPTLQPTEEDVTESQNKRAEAVSAIAEKDYERAIELYTKAIELNPQSSMIYAKRGQAFLLMNKPNACIRDCNLALELNPDNAAAHKFRGRAYHLLGKFEEAVSDLRLACKFDFDEQADEWLRKVTPNARKIEEHKRKKERKAEEKLEREKQERLKRARESAKTQEDSTRSSQSKPSDDMGGFYKFLYDNELLEAFKDPEVAEAFNDLSTKPMNILKYQNNPKIMALIDKMATKFDAVGTGRMGGMPGFPGAAAAAAAAAGAAGAAGATPTSTPMPPQPQDDVGLD
ncbi:putative protein FAM10A4 isoform X1 [Nomia melanderi]|uniref:putative protein FAM10A4 isoform X1 n=2 Tax=Nomia melanderi TaxID=2448451 RepID=UPI003FCDFAE9